jgi:hypothetical protein
MTTTHLQLLACATMILALAVMLSPIIFMALELTP